MPERSSKRFQVRHHSEVSLISNVDLYFNNHKGGTKTVEPKSLVPLTKLMSVERVLCR